jgi:hypothetical protein
MDTTLQVKGLVIMMRYLEGEGKDLERPKAEPLGEARAAVA